MIAELTSGGSSDSDDSTSFDLQEEEDDQSTVSGGTAVADAALDTSDDDDGGGGGVLDSISRTASDALSGGGGAVDTATDATGGFGDTIAEASGVDPFLQSDTGQRLQQQRDEALAEGDVLGALDAGGRAIADLALDNPRGSVQETVQGGMVEAFRLGSGQTDADDEDVAEAWSDAYQGAVEGTDDAVDDTALDNPATDAAVWVADAVVGEAARGAFTGATGVDVETGSTEGTVGPLQQFDVLSLGAAGAATGAARGAAAGADDGATLASRIVSRADDARGGVDDVFNLGGASDEAAQVVDEGDGILTDGGRIVDDAADAGDDALPVPSTADDLVSTGDEAASATDDAFEGAAQQTVDDAVSGVDDAATAGDEAAAATDDAVQAGDDVTRESAFRSYIRAGDDTATGADDLARAGDDAAAGADETASAVDDTATATDDAAQAGDDAAQAVDDADGAVSRFFGSTTGRVLTGSSLFLAGGAIGANLFNTTGTDPDDPDGSGGGGGGPGNHEASDGTPWNGTSQVGQTDAGCVIVRQVSEGGGDERYFTLRSEGGQAVAVGPDGGTTPVGDNTTPGEMPAYDSERGARQACREHAGQSRSGASSSDNKRAARWGELQREAWLPGDDGGDWALAYQEAVEQPDTRRWFVIRSPDGNQLQAIAPDGSVAEEPATDGAMEKLPSYEGEQQARDAHAAWAEQNDVEGGGEDGRNQDGSGGQGSSGGEAWGEWQKAQQVGPWHVYAREHQEEARNQFLVAGQNREGDAVYLQPDGTVAREAHIYTDANAVQEALNTYADRAEAGEVPRDRRPTGQDPGRETIAEDAQQASQQSGGLAGGLLDAVGGPRNAVLLGAAAAGGAWYLDREGHIDLPDLDAVGGSSGGGGA